jgi:hypothetical protein
MAALSVREAVLGRGIDVRECHHTTATTPMRRMFPASAARNPAR